MIDWIKENSDEAKSIGKVQKIEDTFNDAVYTEDINDKRNDWELDVHSDNDGNPKTEYMLSTRRIVAIICSEFSHENKCPKKFKALSLSPALALLPLRCAFTFLCLCLQSHPVPVL